MPTNLPHILLTNLPEPIAFTSPLSGGSHKPIPPRDRQSHSNFLKRKLQEAWEEAQAENRQVVAHTTRSGIYLEFKSYPGVDLITKSLEDMRSSQKIRLLNRREETITIHNESTGEEEQQIVTYATVFVPNDKIQKFTRKFEEYAEKTRANGNPYHADLVNSIADLSKALLVDSFWQDAKDLQPDDNPEWCEVWLSSDSQATINRFNQLLEQQHINAQSGVIRFPERAVKLIYANRSQLEQLTVLSDDIAEYRRAKETAAFWTNLQNRDQVEWVDDLLNRLHVENESQVSVCLLDTGVNYSHPLLAPILASVDCQSVDSTWGVEDHNKHGTLMAGVAVYGNLIHCLSSRESFTIPHRLESVKILPPPPNENEPELWGYMTSQAVSRAEIQAPERKRIICMAVSSSDNRDRGRPSSWSAAIDQVTSGAEDEIRRLIILCSGNCDPATWHNYPDAQLTDSIHDPAQSWNGLTVGAYTILDNLQDPSLKGYYLVAPKEGLSPFTTTSLIWDDKWPIKPEIVLEGGNMAHDGNGFTTEHEDISVLSTYYNPQDSHFDYFNMTSAATAQAAWLAAQIQATYPDLWPETIRALMVHSAEWPEALRQQFGGDDSKAGIKRLMRICGYGVPNLERALYSASNSLTLISQAELQPYGRKENGSGYRTKDMHLYELPWPKEVLLNLPDTTEVEMRVTLSYFIEPGPGEIGWQDRYRYASHVLRFDLNSPEESQGDFIKRINAAARNEDEGSPGTQSASSHWVIGSQTRDKGSIHSDIWRGTAAELASSNLIAVSPRIGWWRERAHLNKWNRQTRYALVVSIVTPEESVDLYTPVATQIGITLPVLIEVPGQ
jgi:hypothetical protein